VTTSRSAKKDGGNILIGTASWTDPGFVARWYPKKMAAARTASLVRATF